MHEKRVTRLQVLQEINQFQEAFCGSNVTTEDLNRFVAAVSRAKPQAIEWIEESATSCRYFADGSGNCASNNPKRSADETNTCFAYPLASRYIRDPRLNPNIVEQAVTAAQVMCRAFEPHTDFETLVIKQKYGLI